MLFVYWDRQSTYLSVTNPLTSLFIQSWTLCNLMSDCGVPIQFSPK